VCRYFARNYTKSIVFNTDQGSQYSEVHTNVLLNNGIKISMDGKGRAIDNILLKDYGGQSNTRMYIYKYMTESAFTEDLKIILNFIIHGDFISH
jgi:putative transposase